MAVSDNAVKAAQKAYRECEGDSTESHRAAITAALPFLPVQGAVKKLEWGELRYTEDYSFAQDAETSIGRYIATDNGWFLQGQSGWKDENDIEAAKAAAQADYEARILSAIEPAATCKESLQVEPAAPEGRQPVADALKLSGNTGELIDKMAEAIRDWGSHYDDGPWETLPEDRKAGWRGDAERALAVVKEYLTTRALSSPDHADAGRVAEVKLPAERVCIPDPHNFGARIVGFRIREGDDAWGETGLSEPISWLNKLLTPDAGKVEGDGCERCGGKGEIVVGKGRHGDTIIEDCPSCSTPQDVINLVIAAREACDTWLLPECEFKLLDKALEAFSERVPYENEPDALPSAPSEGAE
ncbi:hypothetical protein NJB93_14610 [Brucella intermedia]|uniref:hypothetical protein n=1 Tax=Brucella intermedia TaxID=94625 RepID=UPI00209A8AFD|nr:hypothetical protein [Brucella intermedia]MCO7727820.1 hypothetical protein [Brucella intermedia]